MDPALEQKFTSFCTPAQIYLVFSVIFMIVSSIKAKPTIKYVLLHTLYIMGWTLLLNFICSKGYNTLAWFVLFLPFIIVGIIIFVSIIKEQSSNSDDSKKTTS